MKPPASVSHTITNQNGCPGMALAAKENASSTNQQRAQAFEECNIKGEGGQTGDTISSAQLEASATDLANLDAQIKAQQAVAQLEDAIQRPVESWPSFEEGPRRK